jgi:hypothetical protein
MLKTNTPIVELTPDQLEMVSGGIAGDICRGGVSTTSTDRKDTPAGCGGKSSGGGGGKSGSSGGKGSKGGGGGRASTGRDK